MSEHFEWGPWIEHDGNGCPLPKGTFVRCVFEEAPGCISEPSDGFVGEGGGRSWDWSYWCQIMPDGGFCSRIIRYRVRKSASFDQLKRLAESPCPVEPVGEPA